MGQGGGDGRVENAVAVDLFHDEFVHRAPGDHADQGGAGSGQDFGVLATAAGTEERDIYYCPTCQPAPGPA